MCNEVGIYFVGVFRFYHNCLILPLQSKKSNGSSTAGSKPQVHNKKAKIVNEVLWSILFCLGFLYFCASFQFVCLMEFWPFYLFVNLKAVLACAG